MKDLFLVLQASLAASADPSDRAVAKSALVRAMFPYVDMEDKKPTAESYDELFDELDEMVAEGGDGWPHAEVG